MLVSAEIGTICKGDEMPEIKYEFEKVRNLEPRELKFKILLPRKDTGAICMNNLAGEGEVELCCMRLADVVGIDGPVCGSCRILYRYVGRDNNKQEKRK